MAEEHEQQIPVLTEIIAGRDDGTGPPTRVETLIAELQTRLASSTFALTEELMKSAFAEMEATLYEQISARLRRELPELIDTILREHLAREESGRGAADE